VNQQMQEAGFLHELLLIRDGRMVLYKSVNFTRDDLFVCLFVCLLFYGTSAPVGPIVPREV
jgi:hypothetical protein